LNKAIEYNGGNDIYYLPYISSSVYSKDSFSNSYSSSASPKVVLYVSGSVSFSSDEFLPSFPSSVNSSSIEVNDKYFYAYIFALSISILVVFLILLAVSLFMCNYFRKKKIKRSFKFFFFYL
jgi:hypothetical protein